MQESRLYDLVALGNNDDAADRRIAVADAADGDRHSVQNLILAEISPSLTNLSINLPKGGGDSVK